LSSVLPTRENQSTERVNLRSIVSLLLRGAPIALVVALCAGVVAFLLTQRMDPSYQASASLLASRPASSFGNVDLITPPPVDPRVYQRALLEGDLVKTAMERLSGGEVGEAQVIAFKRRMRVSVENQEISSVITVEITDTDPVRAADYANAIANGLIDWDRNRAREMVANSISALERSVTQLDSEIAAAVSSGDAAEAQRLQALGATLREQRVRELEAARARSASAVIVGLLENLSVATPPIMASGPRLVFNVFLAVLLGLVLGYGVQFFIWSLSTSIKDREELSALLDTQVLGELKRVRRNGTRFSPDQVGFFRASLLSVLRNVRPRVIGISSPDDYADKQGVAVSLAESLGRSGLRTLLIDADLRRKGPGLDIDVSKTETPGLETYLQDQSAPLHTVSITADSKIAFDIIPVRTPSKQPSELLAYGFEAFIKRVDTAYDVIVIDLPPVLSYPDALAAAPACSSGIVLAVSVGSSGKQAANAAALLQMNEVELRGAVLTGGSLNKEPKPMIANGRREGAAAPRARVSARVTQRQK